METTIRLVPITRMDSRSFKMNGSIEEVSTRCTCLLSEAGFCRFTKVGSTIVCVRSNQKTNYQVMLEVHFEILDLHHIDVTFSQHSVGKARTDFSWECLNRNQLLQGVA